MISSRLGNQNEEQRPGAEEIIPHDFDASAVFGYDDNRLALAFVEDGATQFRAPLSTVTLIMSVPTHLSGCSDGRMIPLDNPVLSCLIGSLAKP